MNTGLQLEGDGSIRSWFHFGHVGDHTNPGHRLILAAEGLWSDICLTPLVPSGA
ncbi:MAG: hypothetical protein NTV57_09080 [Cyanobacteria bacterium]|nr:hypothetical protein [Cyanobacteriota bacterium]